VAPYREALSPCGQVAQKRERLLHLEPEWSLLKSLSPAAPEPGTKRLFFSFLHLGSPSTLLPRLAVTVGSSGHRLSESTLECADPSGFTTRGTTEDL